MGKHFSSRKLYTCSNKKCPNQSHYTPACPNLAGKNPSPKPAATLPAEPSTNIRNKTLDISDTSEKVTGAGEGKFDRLIAMVEETEPSPRILLSGKKEWRDTSGVLHRNGDQPAVVYPDGGEEWWCHGELHRDNGRPAVVRTNGSQEWWRHGGFHRDDDLPAIIHSDGSEEWWQNGKLHRSGGQPARMYMNGSQEWWQNSELHRDDDLPAIVHLDGSQEWWRHGKLHRDDDLPAKVSAQGRQEWWQNGKRHRTAGPAFAQPNGVKEWWVDDEETEHPDVCEQACAPAQTEQEKEQLVLLCLHNDPVVAAIVVNNPDCPQEGQTVYHLKHV